VFIPVSWKPQRKISPVKEELKLWNESCGSEEELLREMRNGCTARTVTERESERKQSKSKNVRVAAAPKE